MNMAFLKTYACRAIRVRMIFGSLLLVSTMTHAQVISNTKPWFKLQDLTYENPGCRNAWPLDKLDHWLKSNTMSWVPKKTEMPYLIKKKSPGWLSDKEYEEIIVGALKEGIGQSGVSIFSSTNMDKTVRSNQVTWLDIDGDGKCDFIGWSFSYTGMSARGEQGETAYYIFFQRGNGFKLIDYTNEGTSNWSGTQQPDAILPVWIKGEKRPFLVARSNLDLMSGESIAISNQLNNSDIHYRSALRWDASRKTWGSFGYQNNRDIAYLITDFVKRNPPKTLAKPCIDTPVRCEAPQ